MKYFLLSVLVFLGFCAAPLQAQKRAVEEKKQISEPEQVDSTDQAANAIGAGVTRDGDNWSVRLTNDSQDTYSVKLEIVQKDAQGKFLKKNLSSHTLLKNAEKYINVALSQNATRVEANVIKAESLSKAKNKTKLEDKKSDAAAQSKIKK